MKPNTISLNILVDSSRFSEPALVDRLNCLLDEYRNQTATVSYAVGLDEYQPVFAEKPIGEVGVFRIEPEGNAALIESACRLIDETGARLAAMPESKRPEKVIVVFVTNGRDSVSDPKYTRDSLLARIKEQTEVYSWRFIDIGARPEDYIVVEPQKTSTDDKMPELIGPTPKAKDMDVIALSKPIQKTSFQFSADFLNPDGMSVQSVCETAIDTVREWINRKFPHWPVKREKFFSGFDLDVYDLGQQLLHCIVIPEEGRWCLRLIHPDNQYGDHMPIPGRTWTTDMAIHSTASRVRFAIRVFCISTDAAVPVDLVRPRIVPNLAESLGFIDGRPVAKEPWKIEGEKELRELQNLMTSLDRQLPVVLLFQKNDRSEIADLAEALFEKTDTHQSMQAFAHVVLLPAATELPWLDVRDHEDCEIRICFSAPREHVFTLRYDPAEGIDGTAVLIKEELMIHAATRRSNWGDCKFYTEMRTRQAERKRREIESKAEDDTVQHYELMKDLEACKEEIESLKKERDECYRWVEENELKAADFKQKLDKKKQEYYVLFQRLEKADITPQAELADAIPETTRISKQALSMLRNTFGDSQAALRRLISRVGEESWRKKHVDPWHETDLIVFKQVNTAERIAGFLADGVFHVSHVFGNHEEYEHKLKGCKIKDVENHEYVPWDDVL